jgi:hypothetical protein
MRHRSMLAFAVEATLRCTRMRCTRMRCTRIALLAGLVTVCMPGVGTSQPGSPAQRLTESMPELFVAGTLVDAAEAGEQGARIATLTPELTALGFELGDVVLAVEGVYVGTPTWDAARRWDAASARFTVIRRVAGERPVLTPDVSGRVALARFAELEESARTPMRLARMVANQHMLGETGLGVLLLPSQANDDERAWLAVGNPLPQLWEGALADVEKAVRARVQLPMVEVTEAQAAEDAIADNHYLEAIERSSRAALEYVASPDRRGDPTPPFDSIIAIYRDAQQRKRRAEAEMLQASPRFGLFVEGSVSRIEGFLPQHTLIVLDGGSTGATFAAGVRVRILDQLDALVSYGQVRNAFQGAASDSVPDVIDKIETTLHTITLELAYRPMVLSYLKPVLRGGIGLYPLQAKIFGEDGTQVEDPSATELGFTLGGGVDLFNWKSQRLRGTLGGSYRIVSFQWDPNDPDAQDVEGWFDATNLGPEDLKFNPSDPGFPTRDEKVAYLEKGLFELDMDGFQVGLTLTWDF